MEAASPVPRYRADHPLAEIIAPGLGELRLGALDRALVGGDTGGELVDLGLLLVEVLLGFEAFARQRLESLKVLLGRNKLGLVLGFLCHGLIQRCLQSPRIDDGERVAFVHLLALDEVDGLQRAVDLAANGDCVRSLRDLSSIDQ